MIGWIIKLLTPAKAQILGLLGVLAVCGVGGAIIASIHIGRQNDQIETLTATNRLWSENWKKMNAVRELEQANTLALQSKLDRISNDAAGDTERLKKLEAQNAEVKALLGTRLPADLRGLLNKR